MKIDQLPVELLIKIFSYQPTYRQIALVNRRFYGIVCELSDANISLRIDQRFYDRFFNRDVMDAQILQSVRASNRKVSKVEVRGMISFFLDGAERPIFHIVETFAPYIETLTFADAFTREFILVNILTSTPNVEHLNFKYLNLREPRTTEEQSMDKQRCDGELVNLKRLKSLTILSCGNELIRLFHRLPVGVLTELTVSSVEWHDLARLLNHQTNIKKLTLGQQCAIEDPGTVFFDKLELESLQLNANEVNHFTIAAILSKQTRLKSLIFNAKGLVHGGVMTAVSDLLELETLAMDACDTSDESFIDIRKLKNLKNLTLRWASTFKLARLAETDNASMEKLTLEVSCQMSVDLIGALAKSTPHLKQLKILHSRVSTLRTKMDAVLRHFNFVEVLDIPIFHEHFVDRGDYSNAKLRELTITSTGTFSATWLTKLMAAYPNLKTLRLIGGFDKNSVELKPILIGFTKLESLTLKAYYRLTVEDLDYLPDNKHNLNFVSLGLLGMVALTDNRLKKLRDSFGIANVRDGGLLEVAVDRYAINSNAN